MKAPAKKEKGEKAAAAKTDADSGEYKCLVRATDGKKKISTAVSALRSMRLHFLASLSDRRPQPVFTAHLCPPRPQLGPNQVVKFHSAYTILQKARARCHCSFASPDAAKSQRKKLTVRMRTRAGSHGFAQEQKEGEEEACKGRRWGEGSRGQGPHRPSIVLPLVCQNVSLFFPPSLSPSTSLYPARALNANVWRRHGRRA